MSGIDCHGEKCEATHFRKAILDIMWKVEERKDKKTTCEATIIMQVRGDTELTGTMTMERKKRIL